LTRPKVPALAPRLAWLISSCVTVIGLLCGLTAQAAPQASAAGVSPIPLGIQLSFGLASGPQAPAPRSDRTASKKPTRAEFEQLLQQLSAAYHAKTNQELNDLLAKRSALSPIEQRMLVREVKMRMVRSRDRQGVLVMRTQRSFGRVSQRPDGSVVSSKTTVIQAQPVERASAPASDRAANAAQTTQTTTVVRTIVRSARYGTGFENRRSRPRPAQAPVVTVSAPRPAQADLEAVADQLTNQGLQAPLSPPAPR